MGRPRKPVVENAEEIIMRMGSVGCTNQEIADFLIISVDTLIDNYKPIVHKARAEFKFQLRRHQLVASSNKSTEMMKWLGRHNLDQQDAVAQVQHRPSEAPTPGITVVNQPQLNLTNDQMTEQLKQLKKVNNDG